MLTPLLCTCARAKWRQDPSAAAEADEDGDSSEAESVDVTPQTPAAAPAVPQRSSLRSILSRRSRSGACSELCCVERVLSY